MGITVDVHLRESSLSLVRSYFSDVKDGRDELLSTFVSVLKVVIKRRVSCLGRDINTITCEDCFREGKGSIKIDDPPTKAQESIILSLVKVVLHEEAQKIRQTNTVHDNMLFSIFVKVAYVNRYQDSETMSFMSKDLTVEEGVRNIFESRGRNFPLQVSTETKIEVYLYLIKHQVQLDDADHLSSEFDKIELSDSNSDYLDEDTATFNSNDKQFSEKLISNCTKSSVTITTLPDMQLESIWESLYYSSDIKTKLINYSTASLKVASLLGNASNSVCNELVNSNNKMLLVHGPPGTGKTTLCKALCHKLSIRLCGRDEVINESPNSIMMELSCSRIFSRWFGESSKNLSAIFRDIEQLLTSSEVLNNFVFLLIDEVETIASSRRDLSNKNETTDAIRVVNNLLIHLDKMKKYRNFLVLATSNLLDILDNAFVDRADGIFHIDNPRRLELKMMLISVLGSMIEVHILTLKKDRGLKDYDTALDLIATQCEVCF
ncbi:Pachytene checkpoint protein 2 [Nakaseomyces bracarensis]|uniref:Pachytene checkpoint protein 2 n=1 Tax=Nakaseomyces bracarensis TaxID=273131 RepID=A0ABR4P143_9SACH